MGKFHVDLERPHVGVGAELLDDVGWRVRPAHTKQTHQHSSSLVEDTIRPDWSAMQWPTVCENQSK